MAPSLYEILHVSAHASLEEIRTAFKRRALQVHPDKGGTPEAFRAVYAALEVLGDPQRRRHYDRARKAAVQAEKVNAAGVGQQVQILQRLRRCLQGLPRDVRAEAIATELSQRQRLILEKWMVDFPEAKSQSKLRKRRSFAVDHERAALNMKTRRRRTYGAIKRQGGLYRVSIQFDSIWICLRRGTVDLSKAIENLLLLTSVRQQMLGISSSNESFEERLQEAFESAAREQGRDSGRMLLGFRISHATGILLGGGSIRSPLVHSIKELGVLRQCLAFFSSFISYGRPGNRNNTFFRLSPLHLQGEWERLQSAVGAWALLGLDPTKVLASLRAAYRQSAARREQELRSWERMHMGMEDRKRHRTSSSKRLMGKDHLEDDLESLRNLLQRWAWILKKEDKRQQREQERQERERRAALRKRMRAEQTMDEILGKREHWRAGEGCQHGQHSQSASIFVDICFF